MTRTKSSNEIRITRVYDAPLRVVWDAWTVTEQVERWWGPRGFTLTTHKKDLRVGGTWRYTMHGPDGVDYPNVTKYLEVEPLKKLVYDHGGTDDTPPLFRVTVTFAEVDGRTTMDMTMTLESPEAARNAAKFIKHAGGNSTWDRLAEYVAQTFSGKRHFVFNYVVEASLDRVLAQWSSPEQLAKWAGSDVSISRTEGAAGQYTLLGTIAEPGGAALPTSSVLSAEAPDRTRVTVTSELPEDATPAEVELFARERSERALRWTRAFDALDAELGIEV